METMVRSNTVETPRADEIKSYRVEIVSTKGEVVEVIGKHLNERQAEKRVMTGLSRIDRDNYFVRMVGE
jgi:hypothetical protein